MNINEGTLVSPVLNNWNEGNEIIDVINDFIRILTKEDPNLPSCDPIMMELYTKNIDKYRELCLNSISDLPDIFPLNKSENSNDKSYATTLVESLLSFERFRQFLDQKQYLSFFNLLKNRQVGEVVNIVQKFSNQQRQDPLVSNSL